MYGAAPVQSYLRNYYHRVPPGTLYECLHQGHYIIHECTDCGLIYQGEIPNAELMSELYGRWII
jgi:hypothetical protein